LTDFARPRVCEGKHSRVMLIAALFAAPVPVLPSFVPAAVQVEATAAAAPDSAESVGGLVGGIISYARWPTQPRPVRLCLAGATRYALRMSDAQRTAAQSILVRSVRAAAGAAECDVLYLGSMSTSARGRMLAAARGKPIVSIVENDRNCRSGAMFCITATRSAASFKLNLDAVSRSQVRIDPRVLRIASGEEHE
jgi:YfiR/HmsC-like